MRRLAVAVGAVLVLAVGGVAWAAIPNADGNIYACYNTGDGSIRVKDDPAKACAKGWAPLQWTAGQAHVPVTTTYRKFGSIEFAAGSTIGFSNVECNEGDTVVSGGFILGSNTQSVVRSEPETGFNTPGREGWTTQVREPAPPGAAVAIAICQHTE
jgi:hypothetical protein